MAINLLNNSVNFSSFSVPKKGSVNLNYLAKPFEPSASLPTSKGRKIEVIQEGDDPELVSIDRGVLYRVDGVASEIVFNDKVESFSEEIEEMSLFDEFLKKMPNFEDFIQILDEHEEMLSLENVLKAVGFLRVVYFDKGIAIPENVIRKMTEVIIPFMLRFEIDDFDYLAKAFIQFEGEDSPLVKELVIALPNAIEIDLKRLPVSEDELKKIERVTTFFVPQCEIDQLNHLVKIFMSVQPECASLLELLNRCVLEKNKAVVDLLSNSYIRILKEDNLRLYTKNGVMVPSKEVDKIVNVTSYFSNQFKVRQLDDLSKEYDKIEGEKSSLINFLIVHILKEIGSDVDLLADIYRGKKLKEPQKAIRNVKRWIICFISQFSPDKLIYFAKVFIKLEGSDSSLPEAIRAHFLPRLSRYSLLSMLTRMAQSFNILDPLNEPLFSGLASEFIRRMNRLSPQGIEEIATVFCEQPVKNEVLFDLIAKETVRFLNPIHPQMTLEVTLGIVSAFAKFGERKEVVMTDLTILPEQDTPKDLTGWQSVMTEKDKKELLYGSVVNAVLTQLDEITLEELVELCDGLRSLGVNHELLLDAAVDKMEKGNVSALHPVFAIEPITAET